MPISKYIPTAFVSTLPSSPIDGQEIYYQASGAMAASGVVWHLRYNANSSSSYKWQFVGGPRLTSKSLAKQTNTISATTWSDPGAAFSITAPLAGDYLVSAQFSLSGLNSSTYVELGIKAGSTDPTFDSNVAFISRQAYMFLAHEDTVTLTKTTPGTTDIAAMRIYSDAAGTVNRYGAYLHLIPIRLGQE